MEGLVSFFPQQFTKQHDFSPHPQNVTLCLGCVWTGSESQPRKNKKKNHEKKRPWLGLPLWEMVSWNRNILKTCQFIYHLICAYYMKETQSATDKKKTLRISIICVLYILSVKKNTLFCIQHNRTNICFCPPSNRAGWSDQRVFVDVLCVFKCAH